MGMGQWTRHTVVSGSAFHKAWNIKPGEYLMMYDTRTARFMIKDPYKDVIVRQERLNSALDLALLIDHLNTQNIDPELAKKLKRGKTLLRGEGMRDHHIIPVHLWEGYKLVEEAGIDMNGPKNRMLLPEWFHKESHDPKSTYSLIVRDHLRDQWNNICSNGLENDRHTIREVLLTLIGALRENLEELAKNNGSINDI